MRGATRSVAGAASRRERKRTATRRRTAAVASLERRCLPKWRSEKSCEEPTSMFFHGESLSEILRGSKATWEAFSNLQLVPSLSLRLGIMLLLFVLRIGTIDGYDTKGLRIGEKT